MAPVVDIHTHVYPPAYMDILRSRKDVPYIRSFPGLPTERLIILPGEDSDSTSRGRPIGPEYHSVEEKIRFMDIHGIDISVISLANPWLDFIPREDAVSTAHGVNKSLEDMCSRYPGRLFAFGTLPVTADVGAIVDVVRLLAKMKFMRGIILGTSGLGEGMDDPRLDPVYKELEELGQTIFLHPHYGLPKEVYGKRVGEYGHVLPLALGFPLETTIAVSRMYLSGVFDRFPRLAVILAHSGGTLPFLAGRLESCIQHDAHYNRAANIRKGIWQVLKENILLDAVVYSEVGLRAAIDASGIDRMLFGTDNPFFPPLDNSEKWHSVTKNYKAIAEACNEDKGKVEGIMGDNAVRLFNLTVDST